MSLVKLETFKGDAADLLCEIKNEDITNWAIRVEIYDNTKIGVQGVNFVRKATSNVAGGSDDQVIVTNAAKGLFTIFIQSGDTTLFGEDVQLEIQVTDTSANDFTVFKGAVTLKKQRITWSSTT